MPRSSSAIKKDIENLVSEMEENKKRIAQLEEYNSAIRNSVKIPESETEYYRKEKGTVAYSVKKLMEKIDYHVKNKYQSIGEIIDDISRLQVELSKAVEEEKCAVRC
jgi:uncharacterized protein YaaN involved in tellurite resistance